MPGERPPLLRLFMTAHPDGLVETLVRAIRENSTHLNEVHERAGDHPIEIVLHYHPGMAKVDLDSRIVMRARSVRTPRRRRDMGTSEEPA